MRRIFDKGAPGYDREIALFEKLLFGDGRAWVCGRARGDVLELAVGTARNLPFYRPDVRLTGVDLSAAMLQLARERAREIGREVDLHLGNAQFLEFADASFDTVVVTLGLCSIPDPRRAVLEAKRVLRPDGRFLLLEHVRSPALPVRAVQAVLDPVVVRLHADHLRREPIDDVRAAGFVIEELERSKWGIVERAAARRP